MQCDRTAQRQGRENRQGRPPEEGGRAAAFIGSPSGYKALVEVQTVTVASLMNGTYHRSGFVEALYGTSEYVFNGEGRRVQENPLPCLAVLPEGTVAAQKVLACTLVRPHTCLTGPDDKSGMSTCSFPSSASALADRKALGKRAVPGTQLVQAVRHLYDKAGGIWREKETFDACKEIDPNVSRTMIHFVLRYDISGLTVSVIDMS